MEEDKEEIQEKERKTIDDCINPHGLQIDGLGVLMSNSKKTVELLQKIKDLLYFMEKRQQQWFELEHPAFKKEFKRE